MRKLLGRNLKASAQTNGYGAITGDAINHLRAAEGRFYGFAVSFLALLGTVILAAILTHQWSYVVSGAVAAITCMFWKMMASGRQFGLFVALLLLVQRNKNPALTEDLIYTLLDCADPRSNRKPGNLPAYAEFDSSPFDEPWAAGHNHETWKAGEDGAAKDGSSKPNAAEFHRSGR